MKTLLVEIVRRGRHAAGVLRAFCQAPFVAFRQFGTGLRQELPQESVEWALRPVPLRLCVTNFLTLGTPGSGKTTLIRLFLQSLLPRFRRCTDPARPIQRAIIYDAKLDMLPLLDGIYRSDGLSPVERPEVVISNAFDARCMGWNIAQDIASPEDVRYLVTTLLPRDEKAESPFWSVAAQDITRAVVLSLVLRKAPDWSLRDVIVICRSAKLIRQATWDCPEAWSIAASYLNDTKHFTGVLSTLSTKLGRYEEIAAIWHNLPVARRFSVTEWFHGGGILLLGSHPKFNEALAPLNSVMLKLAVDQLLAGPETALPSTWFVLDEFRWLGKAPTAQQLLNQGRSKGASVVLGVQDISGLISVYGEHEANEIMNQCAHKVFMRVGAATANWAEDHFGDYQMTLNLGSGSESTDHEGKLTCSESWGEHIHVAPHYRASTITALPLAGPSTGCLSFISDSPWDGHGRTDVAWADVEPRLIAPGPEINFVPHPSADMTRLAPWSQEVDLARLHLKTPPRAAPEPEKPPGNSGAAAGPANQPPPDVALPAPVQPQLPDLFRD